ncbi:MAG: ATP-grasp domain-containing protein [Flavobacteriales bacterium]
MVVWVLTEARYAYSPSKASSLSPYVQNVLDEDFALVEALRACGLEADRKVWSDPSVNWDAADALVFRTTWDYFDRWDEFQHWLREVQKVTSLINPAACLHWNLDKHYLLDLEAAGIHVVPSTIHKRQTGLSWAEVCQAFNSDDLVIKPTVSGAAKDTYRVTQRQNAWQLSPPHPDPIDVLWTSLLQRQDMMVQPFLSSVVADGELSLMWLGGTVTHAVKKQAKPGDFRVQDDHGGTVVTHDMTLEEREFAERAMHAAVKVMDQRNMGEPLYARVDMVRDLSGAWAVSELEMVEPELWFRMCPDAAGVLARAIAEHLTQPSA